MTDILQPMDLVVNSMVKSFMRKKRIEMTMDYFQLFRNQCLQRNPNLPRPLFNPPTPVLLDVIHAMFEIRPNFEIQEFQDSVIVYFKAWD